MTTYVSNRNSGETDEQGHYRFQTKVWKGNVQNGLAVVQNSPLARNVLVPVGDLKIDYNEYAYTAWNDADEVVAIATADTSNPRIDRIIAYIDRGAALGATNNPDVLTFVAVAGTPAGTPVKANDAAVNTAVGATNPWCELATVRVEANATTIPNSKITDTRVLVTAGDDTVDTDSLQDEAVTDDKVAPGISTAKLDNPYAFCAWLAGAQTPAGNTKMLLDTELYDFGSNFDLTNHRFIAPEDGLYHFDGAVGQLIANGGQTQCALRKNGVEVKRGTGPIFNNSGGNQTMSTNVPADINLVAGDYVELYTAAASNSAAFGSPELTYLNGHLVAPT